MRSSGPRWIVLILLGEAAHQLLRGNGEDDIPFKASFHSLTLETASSYTVEGFFLARTVSLPPLLLAGNLLGDLLSTCGCEWGRARVAALPDGSGGAMIIGGDGVRSDSSDSFRVAKIHGCLSSFLAETLIFGSFWKQ